MTKSIVTYVNGGGDFIYTYNESKLWMKDVTISTHKPENVIGHPQYPKSGLVAFDQSEVKIQDSTIDNVYVEGKCRINFSNSTIEHFETMRDDSKVKMEDSDLKNPLHKTFKVIMTII